MIIVKLMGGLGNQMFQYAAGRSLAHLRGTDLKLDLSFLQAETHGAYTKRDYALDVFKLKVTFAELQEISSFKKLLGNKYRRFLFRKFPFLFNKAYIAESGGQFHKEFSNYPVNTYLDGFWQSEKYFLPVEDTIRADFAFKEEATGLNKELAEKIKNSESVSLHVRRGDFLINEAVKNYHGICPPSYYVDGVKKLAQKHKRLELFIFSDDADWCRQNLNFNFPCTYVDHNQGEKSFEDMRLMSLCKHNIIANSSFSWWGAWLNINPGKTVIAPKQWFSATTKDWKDIYARGWEII